MSKKPPEGPKRFKALDEILTTKDKAFEDVWIEDWETYVRIAVMPGDERDEWEQQIVAQRDQKNYRGVRSGLVARVMVDEHGQRLVTTPEQIKALGEKSAKVLDLLFAVARRVNKLDQKDIKELEGN